MLDLKCQPQNSNSKRDMLKEATRHRENDNRVAYPGKKRSRSMKPFSATESPPQTNRAP